MPGSEATPGAASAGVDHDVVAVIVTWQPDRDRLERLLEQVVSQVARVIVVDNGSQPPLAGGQLARPAVSLLRQSGNLGVAAAQNCGMRAALAAGARYVLLLDQDGLPGPDMTTALRDACRQAEAGGLRVAAVGPAIVESDGSCEGFIRFGGGRYEAVSPQPRDTWLPCDMLIASGSLIPREAFEALGGMAEQLFIDKIDTEWSLRAAAAGYALIGAPRARLLHQLGERSVRLWFFGSRELRLHKPFRYYYMVRNSLLLQRLPHAHAAWRRADRRQLLSILLYFGILSPGRLAALGMMLRGAIDGLRSVSGPLR